ncbi:podocalyxin isoform X1 [Pogona vitticeps]
MRRGHARGGEGAAGAMRSALRLALVLVAGLSCGCGASSTTVAGEATSTTLTTASPTTRAKSSEAAPAPTSGAGIAGSSPSVTKTTAKASSATTVSPVVTKGSDATTPKGTTPSLGTPSPLPSGARLTTAKPTTPPVTGASTQRTGATTVRVTPPVVTPLTRSSTVSSEGPARSTSSSSDASGKATGTSPTPKETSPSVAPTASHTPTTTAVHATSGEGVPAVLPGSDAPGNVTMTRVTPGGAVVTTAPKRGHTSPEGAIPTPVTTPGGTQGSTPPPPPPPAFSTTSDLTRRTSATTLPEPHLTSSPLGGSKQGLCAAHTKIICESVRPSEYQGILLTMNESRTCESLENIALKDSLMNIFCKAVKPNFNQSRDVCTANMAPVAGHPQKLAVLSISVTLCLLGEELSESLAVKKAELEKLGFSNFTYGGKTPDIDGEDRFGMPLIITIVCMAASLLLVAAIYGCCHQRISRRKDQQRLTEELQTMENGYHDNPTLEVMETSAEMQEKKVNLNGELGDSWIVPMDSLTKEDLEEEEDTHL